MRLKKKNSEALKIQTVQRLYEAQSRLEINSGSDRLELPNIQSEIHQLLSENQNLRGKIASLTEAANSKAHEFNRIIQQIDEDFKSIEAKYRNVEERDDVVPQPTEIEYLGFEEIKVTDQSIEDPEGQEMVMQLERNKAIIDILQKELSEIDLIMSLDDEEALLRIYEVNQKTIDRFEKRTVPAFVNDLEEMSEKTEVLYGEDVYVSKAATDRTERLEYFELESPSRKNLNTDEENEINEDNVEVVSINNMSYISHL